MHGFGFGDKPPTVTLGNKPVVMDYFSNTQLELKLPSLSDGEYPLLVNVKGKGYADLR